MFYAWTSQKYLLVMMFMALINYMGAFISEYRTISKEEIKITKMINNENDFVDYNIITDV